MVLLPAHQAVRGERCYSVTIKSWKNSCNVLITTSPVCRDMPVSSTWHNPTFVPADKAHSIACVSSHWSAIETTTTGGRSQAALV